VSVCLAVSLGTRRCRCRCRWACGAHGARCCCPGSTLNHWPFPYNHLMEGYAYILTHPGTPCIFYDHFYGGGGLGDAVRSLVRIRKKHGLNNRSKVRWVRRAAGVPWREWSAGRRHKA
jgi:hypothetical protein